MGQTGGSQCDCITQEALRNPLQPTDGTQSLGQAGAPQNWVGLIIMSVKNPDCDDVLNPCAGICGSLQYLQ